MARTRTIYRCSECGAAEPKWAGRCASCEAWNSLVEEIERPAIAGRDALLGGGAGHAPSVPLPIAEVDMAAWSPAPTHLGELDRVLQGGLVPGSVTLLGGEPGIGKSTLLLQALAGLAKDGRRCLYVAAEESAQQVRVRAERLGALPPNLWLVAELSLPALLEHVDAVRPDVVAVDSIQTVYDPQLSSAPGSVAQVRECAHRLVRASKDRAMASVLVGHVTKDGSLAGPRVLEHLVDTVLSFEGERHHALRLLRAVKHRFGSIDELGLFEMTDAGMAGVPDPSALFLADRRPGTTGSVVASVLDGLSPAPRRGAGPHGAHHHPHAETISPGARRRPPGPRGRRAAAARAGGVPAGRCAHGGGGWREGRRTGRRPRAGAGPRVGRHGHRRSRTTWWPAARWVSAASCARSTRQPRRLAEAARLGFKRAIVPASASVSIAGMHVLPATTVLDAIRLAGLGRPAHAVPDRRAS